ILLFVLVSLEVGFFIWAVWSKESYKFEKSVANLSFASLYLLGLVTGLISFGFRYFVITVVLLVKVILSVITIIKKTKLDYKLSRSIRKLVSNVLLVMFALTSAIVFPQYEEIPVSGNYEVETSKYTWVDKSRMETYQNNEIHRALT